MEDIVQAMRELLASFETEEEAQAFLEGLKGE
jgi:hypothetical protein